MRKGKTECGIAVRLTFKPAEYKNGTYITIRFLDNLISTQNKLFSYVQRANYDLLWQLQQLYILYDYRLLIGTRSITQRISETNSGCGVVCIIKDRKSYCPCFKVNDKGIFKLYYSMEQVPREVFLTMHSFHQHLKV